MSTYTLHSFKAQAKALRQKLIITNPDITHSQCLELIAHENGYKDWNGLSAFCQRQDSCPVFSEGSRVSGDYLSQAFTGTIIAMNEMAHNHYKITLLFDESVDVVQFDSFSSHRQRVTALVTKDGVGIEHTSDKIPHLIIRRVEAPKA
ncbi:glyoxalase superfamily protein [Temperatibacter marinus]|uniref:Glyoxalase superfamily protein n=1 Tax=Temperatibacter marinus TaxID=1456591 RepID=A0AA52EJ27_9PROT|nr:glyoxalase superfamily protein [Temperatibacter marinus]WND02951.1 glyoxalase superfamily protein [Temperatibacter marinus]